MFFHFHLKGIKEIAITIGQSNEYSSPNDARQAPVTSPIFMYVTFVCLIYIKQSPRQNTQTEINAAIIKINSLWFTILFVNWYYLLIILLQTSSSASNIFHSSIYEICSSSSASIWLSKLWEWAFIGYDFISLEEEWRMMCFRKLWCVAWVPYNDQVTMRLSIKKFQSFWIDTRRIEVMIAVRGITNANQMYFFVS